ncbi:Helix-turn-helix domain [Mycobacteroides abscessus subsp. bolletii]|uniref:helix-turn-helix transcriptional regulator n=1 Tax=Mycobacteroides abscessus TaxID=36809 RepID=UPI0009A79F65|nr:helix-turn-helix domain-containing protein [Mycobacteroides abscessus]SKX65875.1 Helix-turn-helix domain [Mycobacteroides abscessus subsp. bolletii]
MAFAEDCWLTRPEVSERMKVPKKTLAQWASQSRGPKYYKFGGHVRYRLSDVIAWETSQLVGGAA